MNIPMNKEQYAEFWDKESNNFESLNIYKTLTESLPEGKILEIGCGNGLETYYLSKTHDVLALDNNEYLIDKAKKYLKEQGIKQNIHKCDLFNLTDEDKKVINDFKPNIIVAWFIGAGGGIVEEYTQEEENLNLKVKLYREKIEDIIVSQDILVDSVKIISFALRGGKLQNSSDEEIFIANKQDYDTYVFNNTGFEVTNVKSIEWNRDGSDFTYSIAPNPNIPMGTELIPTIILIQAERIND